MSVGIQLRIEYTCSVENRYVLKFSVMRNWTRRILLVHVHFDQHLDP